MKIAFNFDLSKKIGSGHFYRCLALGKNLKKKGVKVYFLIQGKIESKILKEIKKSNFFIKYLKKKNIGEIINYLIIHDIRSLVIDKPNSNINIQKKLKTKIKLLIVIQDIPKHNYCDILLNQNYLTYTKKKYKKLSRKNTKLLLIPLKDDYYGYSDNALTFFDSVCFIIIDPTLALEYFISNSISLCN